MSIPGYKDPNKVRVNAYVPKDQHGRLKIAAIESETTIEELILHGIQLVLKVPTSKPGRDRRRSDGK